jgi:RNase P protein component
MLPKGDRLPQAVFTGRAIRRARFEFGSVSIYPTTPPKVVVIVSKKVAASAVHRNAIRRRLIHALKPVIPRLTHSVALYPTKEVRTAPLPVLTQALEQVLVTR